MTLLDPRITSDFTTTEGYPRPMTQDVSLQRPANPEGPWPPYPPPPPPRRGLGAIIIAAAVIVAAGLVAGLVAAALVMNRGDNREDAPPVAQPPTTSATVAAEDSSTCDAWQSTRPAMVDIPRLPAGWDWDTPNIDTLIANRTAAIDKALDLFEPQIADDPADVAEAARTFVGEQRKGNEKLKSHTYTGADAVVINEASTRLSLLCGMSTG